MIRVEEMFESELELPSAISLAVKDYGEYMFEYGDALMDDERTRLFFMYLIARGGTAIEFDWIRGQGFCEIDDFRHFADVEGKL